MSLALISKFEMLKDRATLLARCRAFFAIRGVIEVDVPILSRGAPVDLHIDLIKAQCCGSAAYLHSSPEYGMKRLLAEGSGDIYQISHVFRDNESGCRHTPEFTMAEWYRIGFTFEQMIEETIAFIHLFLPQLPDSYEEFSYVQAFQTYAGYYPSSSEKRDELMAFEIEPQFGQGSLTLIKGFPPEQAALARLSPEGVAMRFEIYYQGIELANGYAELTDPKEQRRRLNQANLERSALGKESLPIDEEFLKALERGIPDCCGVAVGFDRLMMLRNHLEEIREASSFFI